MLAYKLIIYLLLPIVVIEGLDPFVQSECGKEKSCLRWSSCNFPTCDFALSWKSLDYNGTKYLQIELSGKLMSPTSGYLAMGFSVNNTMVENGVVACMFENGNFNISAAYNLKHKNYLLPEDGYDQNFLVKFKDSIYGIEFDSQTNILRCRFLRLMNPIINSAKLKNLTGGVQYFVLTATGAVTNGVLRYHYTNKRPSYVAYDFQSTNWIDSILAANVLMKLHGCCMIVGWVFMATNGIIMANFYKGNWPTKQLFKGKIWFQIHRMVQSTCVLFVSVGFILIFVSVRGYSSSLPGLPYTAHPIIGIVATGLMFTNLIMAFFRCHPDDSNRWIFNRLHFLVGISAYVLAIVTMIIGIHLPSAGPNLNNLNFPWILVTIFLGLIILLFIYGEIRLQTKERISNSVTLNDNLTLDMEETQKRPSGYEVIIISVILSFVFGTMFIVFVAVY